MKRTCQEDGAFGRIRTFDGGCPRLIKNQIPSAYSVHERFWSGIEELNLSECPVSKTGGPP